MAAAPARFARAGAADAATAAEFCRALRRWLRDATDVAANLRATEGVLLTASNNCVEHAYRAHPTAGTMKLHARHDPGAQSINVRVSDHGTWHRPLSLKPNDPRASRGIIRAESLGAAHPAGSG